MKTTLSLFVISLIGICSLTTSTHAQEINFGDHKSSTLTVKAWQALNQERYEDAIVYTKKCLELYKTSAKEMQDGLTDFVKGTDEEIHSYWALNDVSTSLFIQAKALIALEKTDEAKSTIQNLVENFTFGQCWDPSGWFWEPSTAAKGLL